MSFRKLTLAAACLTMVTGPVAAQASMPLRSAGPISEEADLGGGSDVMKALIILLIASIGMVYLLVTDDEDQPVSP